MKCEICGKSASEDGVTLWRVNPLGITGVWRCGPDLTKEQVFSIDPSVREVVLDIQKDVEEIEP